MLYRILTEDKNRKQVEDIIRAKFPGFTLYQAEGHWRLQREQTLIIEIETDLDEPIMSVARDIKLANQQEAVLVQRIQNSAVLV